MASDSTNIYIGNNGVTNEQQLKIRDLVLEDPTAMEKWNLITDALVDVSTDRLKINKMLQNCDYANAVLYTLQTWSSSQASNATITKLIEVYKKNGLVRLARITSEKVGRSPSGDLAKQNPVLFVILFVGLATFSFITGGFNKGGSAVTPYPDFVVSLSAITLLAETIADDDNALRKWPQISYRLVKNRVDNLKIIKLLAADKYSEAILRTLQYWSSAEDLDAKFSKVVDALRKNGCKSLAGLLEKDYQTYNK